MNNKEIELYMSDSLTANKDFLFDMIESEIKKEYNPNNGISELFTGVVKLYENKELKGFVWIKNNEAIRDLLSEEDLNRFKNILSLVGEI